jgi:hypothetical protein
MAQLSFPMPDDGRSGRRAAYVTVAEAAAELRCHERTIRRAIDLALFVPAACGVRMPHEDRGGSGARISTPGCTRSRSDRHAA